MKIVDLDARLEPDYLVCLEEWSEEFAAAREMKARWLAKMRGKGLRVKIALTDEGVAGGMIETMPIEHGFAEGRDLRIVNCIWVHGYEGQGRGNLQGRGMGRALLAAAEEQARDDGARGLAAWGLAADVWMPANWFRRHGFLEADTAGPMVLLWKPFEKLASAPRWIRGSFAPPDDPKHVTVTATFTGQCCSENAAFLRAKRAAEGFAGDVEFVAVDLSEEANRRRVGLNGGIYVQGENLYAGPPPDYAAIVAKIRRALEG